ncbi:MAG: hypothetical protein WBD36_04115 [Bacteroidota bacterium]
MVRFAIILCLVLASITISVAQRQHDVFVGFEVNENGEKFCLTLSYFIANSLEGRIALRWPFYDLADYSAGFNLHPFPNTKELFFPICFEQVQLTHHVEYDSVIFTTFAQHDFQWSVRTIAIGMGGYIQDRSARFFVVGQARFGRIVSRDVLPASHLAVPYFDYHMKHNWIQQNSIGVNWPLSSQ